MLSVEELFETKLKFEITQVLKVVSRNGASDILYRLEKGPLRFSDIMFETKLNPGILDKHLKALMEMGFVEKRDGVYELTPRGVQLVKVLKELLAVFK